MEWHSCIADLLNDRCAMPVWLFTWLVFYTTKLGKLIVNVMTVGFYLTILFFLEVTAGEAGSSIVLKGERLGLLRQDFFTVGKSLLPI